MENGIENSPYARFNVMQAFNINEDLVQQGRKKHNNAALKSIWKRSSDLFNNAWGWECVSYLCSIFCLIAVVILLALSDGKAHVETPSIITLNALIAAGCAFSKGLMIVCVSACIGQFKFLTGHLRSSRLIDVETYNAASQGAIGALRLLVKPKALRMSLLGACIIIAALALDPIAQQLVSYSTRTRVVAVDEGHINVSVILNGRHKPSDNTPFDPFEFIDPYFLDFLTKSGKPPYSCSSESCSWPEYVTIGACNECYDITPDLKSEVNVPSVNTFNKTWPRYYSSSLQSGHSLTLDGGLEDEMTVWNASVTDLSDASLNYSASPLLLEFSLISLRQDHSETWISDHLKTVENINYIGPVEKIRHIGPIDEQKAREPIHHHAWSVSASTGERLAATSWEAYHCKMSLCVQHRKPSVRNFIFSDEIVNEQIGTLDCSYKDTRNESHWCAMHYRKALPRLDKEKFLESLYLPKKQFYSKYPEDYELSEEQNRELFESDHGVIRPAESLLVLEQKLSDWRKALKELFQRPWVNLNSTTFQARERPFWVPYFDRALPAYIDDLADFVTSHMRNDGDPAVLGGDAVRDETFVQVNWSWLTLPLILLCSTLVLLVSTIKETKRAKVRPWKSSTLPLLMDGLDFIEPNDYEVEIPELERRAKQTPLGLHKFWRAISSKSKAEGGPIQI